MSDQTSLSFYQAYLNCVMPGNGDNSRRFLDLVSTCSGRAIAVEKHERITAEARIEAMLKGEETWSDFHISGPSTENKTGEKSLRLPIPSLKTEIGRALNDFSPVGMGIPVS